MIDFLLIAALDHEFRPLLDTFNAKPLQNDTGDSYQHYEAELKTKNELSYSIRLVCAGGKGQALTTAALGVAIPKWKPRYVIMSGFAATIPGEKRHIKDILVADTIVNLTEWKILPFEDEARPLIYYCDRDLVKPVRNFFPPKTKKHVGIIVSQNNLVKSSKLREKLVDQAAKVTGRKDEVIGIEMEGGGLGVGVINQPRDLRPGLIMIKGAVDFANYHKNKRAQKRAAHKAAEFVRAFLISGPVGKTPEDKQLTTPPIEVSTSTGYSLGRVLIEEASTLYTKFSTAQARTLMRNGQGVYQNPFIVPYLKWKYPGKSLLLSADHEYPVAVYPVKEAQQIDPESILCRPISRSRQGDDLLLPRSAKYRALAHRLDLEAYDRPCFTLKHLLLGESLQIECEMGSYLRALDTCDELAWEIYTQHEKLLGSSEANFREFDSQLSLRARLHSEVSDPVCDGRRRSAAIAISTLLAFYDENELHLLLKRRGTESVAVHVGMAHVVPSFMFQPATSKLDSEFSVKHNLFREYLEELFNRPEPEEREGDWQYFYRDHRLEYLLEILNNGRAQIYLTGLAVNLLNLRPEICLLLYIRDPDWYRFHSQNPDPKMRFQFNNEWMRVTDMGPNAETAIASLRYSRDEADLLTTAGLHPWEIVPPGAAALWLGKKLLDRLV